MTIRVRDTLYDNPTFLASKPRPITIPAGFTTSFFNGIGGGETPGPDYAQVMTDVAGTMLVLMPLTLNKLKPNRRYTVSFRAYTNMSNSSLQPVIRPNSATDATGELIGSKPQFSQIAASTSTYISTVIDVPAGTYTTPFAGFYLRSLSGAPTNSAVSGYVRFTEFRVVEALPVEAILRRNMWWDPFNVNAFVFTSAGNYTLDHRVDGTFGGPGRVTYLEKLAVSGTVLNVGLADNHLTSRLVANTKYTLKFKIAGSITAGSSIMYRPVSASSTTNELSVLSPLITSASTTEQKEVTFTTGSNTNANAQLVIILNASFTQNAWLKIWDVLLVPWTDPAVSPDLTVFSGSSASIYNMMKMWGGTPNDSESFEYDPVAQIAPNVDGTVLLPFSAPWGSETIDVNFFENPRGQDTAVYLGTDCEVQGITHGTYGACIRTRKTGNFGGNVTVSLKKLRLLQPSTTYRITMNMVLTGIAGTSVGISMTYRPADGTSTTGESAAKFVTLTKDVPQDVEWILTTSATLPGTNPQGITFTLGGSQFDDSSDYLLFRTVCIREGTEVLPFWDANTTPPEPDAYGVWEGVVGDSRSLKQINVDIDRVVTPSVGVTIMKPDLTPIVAIPRARNPMFLEEYNRDGGGSFEIRIDDDVFVNQREVFTENHLVRVVTPGKVGWYSIDRPDAVTVDTEGSQWLKIAGPGPLSWLRHAVVYPGTEPVLDDARHFNFGSPIGDWYNAANWTATPVEVTSSWVTAQPADGWPFIESTSKWIWDRAGDAPQGTVYFRQPLTYTGSKRKYKLFASARNKADFFMDGVKLISIDEPNAYLKTFTAEVELDAGQHIFAIRGSSVIQGLRLPGGSGYASTPDTGALDITGDIDLRAHVALDDWTPPTDNACLIAKWNNTGNQRSYLFQVLTTGSLRLIWSTTGSDIIIVDSTVAPTVTNGADLWVRVTLDVNNGASGRTVTFYTSNDGVSWTQLGDPVTSAGVTSIFAGTSVLEIGTSSVGTADRLIGVVHSAEVRSGIDGSVVADPDFYLEAPLTTSFVDDSGKTWTINSAGVIGRAPAAVRAIITKVPADGSAIVSGDAVQWTNTDTLWDMNAYPATPPGWTPGHVMLQLLSEARARSVARFTSFTEDFFGLTDSLANAWSAGLRLDWDFDIGITLRDVVSHIIDVGVDVWMSDNLVLRMTEPARGTDLTVPVVGENIVIFAPGINVQRSVSQADQTEIVNALLMSTKFGLQTFNDSSTSQTDYGKREGFVSLNNISDSGSVGLVKDAIFNRQRFPLRYPSITIIAIPSHTPWVDFQVGDWVWAPDDEMMNQMVKRRVMSIVFSEDKDTGALQYEIEIDSIAQDRDEKLQRWLTRIDAGALGGIVGGSSG